MVYSHGQLAGLDACSGQRTSLMTPAASSPHLQLTERLSWSSFDCRPLYMGVPITAFILGVRILVAHIGQEHALVARWPPRRDVA
jgi:hypothetical protein